MTKTKFHIRKRRLRRRLTHSQTAGLEDALAVAVDIIKEQEQSRVFVEARTRSLLEILQTLRAGPHAYDPNRPAGRRYIIRRVR